MNLRFCKILLFLAFCFSLFGCWEQQSETQSVIVVKVMPLSAFSDAPREAFYWERQKFLFPQIEIPNPLPEGVPNDDSLLNLTVEKDGDIKLNTEFTANLSNIESLQTKLENIFRDRTKNKVFEPNSEKVVKAIAVKASRRLKYKDLIKVLEIIKRSGAEPIVLQIDDLPE